jgi:hypothetical protein
VGRLKPFDAEVRRLWGILTAKEAELIKSQQARTSTETKATNHNRLTSQLAEKTEECILLRAQQAETDAKLIEKLKECIHLQAQNAETKAKLADVET